MESISMSGNGTNEVNVSKPTGRGQNVNIVTGVVINTSYSRVTDHLTVTLSSDVIIKHIGYIEIKLNDKFYAIVDSDGFITQVRVNVPENLSYVNYFIEVYFKDYGKKVFNDLKMKVPGDLFEYLEKASSILVNSPGEFKNINVLKSEVSWKKFLFAWYKNCYSRPLRILGITADMVDNMLINDHALHVDMKNVYYNPYTNPWLPPDVCKKITILFSTHTIIHPDDEMKHGFVHEVSLRVIKNKWNYCPKRFYHIPNDIIEDLVERFGLYEDDTKYYIETIRRAQQRVINFLVDLVETKYDNEIPRTDVLSYKISQEQLDIIENIMHGGQNVTLVSGRAGTGKTRLIAELAYKLEKAECYYMIVSFTGKAVARVKETIKNYHPDMLSLEDQVTTIHRLMTCNIEKMPNIEFLIIDEFSMVSTKLLYKLINTFYKKIRRIVGVGDNNQLSPIEWGSIYSQMYQSQCFTTFELKTCFRVSEESGAGILKIANGILDDPKFKFEDNANFISKCYSESSYTEQLEDMVSFCHTFPDGIILTVYNKEKDYFNNYIQNRLRSGETVISKEDFSFHTNRNLFIGDKVMQKENINEQNVFNGDIGEIVDVHPDYVLVLFKSKSFAMKYFLKEFSEVTHTIKDFRTKTFKDVKRNERNLLISKDLDLAFVITVNKSQGSEFPQVMGVLTDIKPGNFVNMELIYTMISRAQLMFFLAYTNRDVVTRHAKMRQAFKFDETKTICQELLPNISEACDFGYIDDDVDYTLLM